MPAYSDRVTMFGLVDKDTIKSALAKSSTYVLDVRAPEEIDNSIDHANYRQATCTADGCPGLEGKDLAEIVPDKEAVLVIYCRSGKRAGKAKEMFEQAGYKNVLNAGGYDDISDLV